MARCVVKSISSFLPTGTSHSIQKVNFVMPPKLVNSHSVTYCAFRYFTSLKQRDVYIFNESNSNTFSHDPPLSRNGTLYKYKKSLLTDAMTIRTFSMAPQFCHPQSKEVKTGVSKYGRRKSARSSMKEFTIKGKTDDRDMSIKLGKIQGHLDKGKTIEIFVKHNSGQDNSGHVEKKLKENLQNVTKFRMDYSNEHTTKFTIIPSTKAEEEKITPVVTTDSSNSKTNAS